MGSRLGSWNLHYACETRGCGDHEAFFAHTLEMKLDGLLNQAFYFLARISNRDNTRKVWNVSAPGSRSFLVNDGVFHESSSFRSNPALRRIAFKGSNGYIFAGLARYRHYHALVRVPELPVTSSGRLEPPTVRFQQVDQISDLHTSHDSALEFLVREDGGHVESEPTEKRDSVR